MSAPDPAHPDELRIVSRAHPSMAVEPASAAAAAAALAPASASASASASAAPAQVVRAMHPVRRRPASAAVAHAAPPAPAWDYAGPGGPDAWGRLKPEYTACASGTRQSPIDIRDGIKVELAPIRFDYQPGAFDVIDDGHTVQVNVAPGSAIEVLGRRYALVQFHFHRPAEERIDGKPFDMVVHLVHRDSEGRIAIVAVLLERGSALKVVQNVWNNLPLEQRVALAAPGMLNPNELLPTERSYYTYMGSRTTPPCTEGVLWMVMKTPVPISAEQIAVFAHLYPMNARPIQPAGGRLIKESN
ncbi:MAG: carbonic anhydrase family protein [Burkholderiales bacterium]|nr:carbonic anhydrase family protein [Burkholderiales bacterium]